jgi:hypothetical protein
MKEKFNPKTCKIIMVDWIKAGIFNVIHEPNLTYLDEMQLKPDFQWKWIWGDLIKKEILSS